EARRRRARRGCPTRRSSDVLNDGGKVIGCIARSVSRSLPKKYYHPVVRVAVIYQGMLYLVNRGKKSFVSPDTIDYPFYSSVLFRSEEHTSVLQSRFDLVCRV